ncbi:hypothetical protein [Streptomyces sp. NPDC048295]|uniref:hypothetical protein n=1 Tax=Streptomyces sp. NPDC048295 TaxID=3154617 RepID=UPI00341E127E
MTRMSMTVDGTRYADEAGPRLPAVHRLRDRPGLTGARVGCDTGNRGARTVEPDGDGVTVKSCSVPAVRADGGEARTVRASPATAGGHRCGPRSANSTRCSAVTARPA